ncbi:STM3941 family protein [Hymenobacter baengnokdamensis]|uniref:STM3941 family protein n=1 Tax=Hymenobacter baengnokdamensis TaxID=2615203 RepID=UPI0012461A9B|nr:STM3941 family protein [Hymenobacter baengnokdamensis]
MQPLIVRYSRWYFVLQPLMFVAFASGPFVILHETKHLKILDLLGIILLGTMAVITGWGLVQLIHRKPFIVLNDNGVFNKDWGMGTIPWSDIEQTFISSERWPKHVELLICNPDSYLKRQFWLRRILTACESAFGKSPFLLLTGISDTTADTVVEYICQQLSKQRTSSV